MLSTAEFTKWCQRLQLPASTCELIASIRTVPPVQRGSKHTQGMWVTHPSHKMGTIIHIESLMMHQIVQKMELDPDVLEFYNQPMRIKIKYQGTSGRSISLFQTPDFFVIRVDSAGFEEWKSNDNLQDLAVKMPNRYQQIENGNWKSPPGEAYTMPLGLYYHVHSSTETKPVPLEYLTDIPLLKAVEPTKTIKIFYCYARKDKMLRDVLESHLEALRRSGQITTWYDREILPGADWKREIDTHLSTSDIILLLVSPNFMRSNYCYGVEMRRALEKHKAGDTRVIPVILRPVDWKETPIGDLQALPANGKPVTTWRNRDEAFHNVARGIAEVVKVLLFETQPTEKLMGTHSSTLNYESNIDPFTLDVIEKAILRGQQLEFTYRSPHKGEGERHVIEPQPLTQKNGHIYLHGWSIGYQVELRFRLDSILPGTATMLPTRIVQSRPARRTYLLRYHLTPILARNSVSNRFPEQKVEHHPDGSATITAQIDDLFAARQTLLNYGENCIVESPPELIELMRPVATHYARTYLTPEE